MELLYKVVKRLNDGQRVSAMYNLLPACFVKVYFDKGYAVEVDKGMLWADEITANRFSFNVAYSEVWECTAEKVYPPKYRLNVASMQYNSPAMVDKITNQGMDPYIARLFVRNWNSDWYLWSTDTKEIRIGRKILLTRRIS